MKIYLRKIFCSVCVILMIFSLNGCATNYDKYDYTLGNVVSVQKVADKDMTPDKGTLIGAGSGATIGAIVGGVAGVAATAATFGLAAPAIPVLAAEGALIGGGGGAVAGYIYDHEKAGSGLYEYTVITEDREQIRIRQIEDRPLEIGTEVKVIWDKGQRIIIPLKKDKIVDKNAK